MLVLGINKILKWSQITTGWGTYTCPIKEVSGEMFFKFKRIWHPITDFVSEYTTELVEEGERIFSRPFKK